MLVYYSNCQICQKPLSKRAWMQREDGLCHLHRASKRVNEKYKNDAAFREARKQYGKNYWQKHHKLSPPKNRGAEGW